MAEHVIAPSLIVAVSVLAVLACQPERTSPVSIVYDAQQAGGDNFGDGTLGGDGFEQPAPWWEDSWAYRRAITISAVDSLVAGFSVSFGLNHASLASAGVALASGNDLRILRYDGASWTELDRFASPPFNDSATRLWFSLQRDLAAGQSSGEYWVYYGNPFAVNPPQNPAKVLLFRSTFGSGSLSDWDQFPASQPFVYATGAAGLCKDGGISAQYSSTPFINDKLVLSSLGPLHGLRVLFNFGPGAGSVGSFDDDLFAAGLCSASTNVSGFYTGFTGGGDWFDGQDVTGAAPAAGYFASGETADGDTSAWQALGSLDPTTQHVFDASWTAQRTTIRIDGDEVGSWADGPEDPGLFCLVANSMEDICVREMTLRHHVDNDPTVSLGAVEIR